MTRCRILGTRYCPDPKLFSDPKHGLKKMAEHLEAGCAPCNWANPKLPAGTSINRTHIYRAPELPDPSGLYADSGGDVTLCEICDEPLDETQEWKRGLDGAGAHLTCLRNFGVQV